LVAGWSVSVVAGRKCRGLFDGGVEVGHLPDVDDAARAGLVGVIDAVTDQPVTVAVVHDGEGR
jgi:hypothetical protein